MSETGLSEELLAYGALRAGCRRDDPEPDPERLGQLLTALAKEGTPPGRELVARHLVFDALPWAEEHLPRSVAAALLAELDRLSAATRTTLPGTGVARPAPVFGPEFHERYELGAPLGEGGMGLVYRAVQRSLQREVAIKVLSPQLATDANLRRFREEARAAARIFHPNLVAVIETGETAGCPFIVFELVEGPSLRRHLERTGGPGRSPGGPLPLVQALDFARQAADGVACAHKHGIIHRDLKPDNLLIAGNVIKVGDFGIAKSAEATGDAKHRTQAGQILGTPLYMSPEQAQERPLTASTDVYSLGVVLFEMIAGRPPFDGANTLELLENHVKAPPPALPHGTPDAVCALVERALAKTPEERFGSMSEFAEALARIAAEVGGASPALLRRSLASGPIVLPVPPSPAPSSAATVMTAGVKSGPVQRGTVRAPILERPRPWSGRAVALLAALAAIGAGAVALRGRPPAPPPPAADEDWSVNRGLRAGRRIALTFDGGPTETGDPDTGTRAILKALEESGSHGSFFVAGEDALERPDLVRRIVQGGHTLGSEGSRRCKMAQLTLTAQQELVRDGADQIRRALGDTRAPLRYFRLPHGDQGESGNPATLAAIHAFHPTIVQWSIDTVDWKDWGKRDWPHAAAAVTSVADPSGAIVLFHENAPGMVAATRELIRVLKPKGYTFVSLDELLTGNPIGSSMITR